MPTNDDNTPKEHGKLDATDDGPSFEDVVAAALRVDPTGIAGKHRKPKPDAENGGALPP